MRREGGGLDRHLLEEVDLGGVAQRVHGVEAERVDVEVLEPHPHVVEDVAAHLGRALAVEVDQVAPGVAPGLEVGPEEREVVARRAEVVVHHVLHDAQPAGVAGVDEAAVGVRAAVGLGDREPRDAVVAPVVGAVEGVDRHHLDEVDAEVDEVVEPLDRGVEGAAGGEGADVQLVDHRPGELAPGPAGVLPLVGRHVAARQPVHAVGLAARARVGPRVGLVVEEVAVVDRPVGHRAGRRPPVVVAAGHRDDLAGHLQADALGPRGPDVVRTTHLDQSFLTSRATGCTASRSASRPSVSSPVSTSCHVPGGQVERRVAPAAGGLEADGEPGDDRDRATAVVRHDVAGGGARRGDRGVAGEQLGPLAAQGQRRAGDVQLGGGVVLGRAGEHGGAVVEVDRAAVVGVDERGLPQLAALVDVGHARHRQGQQLRRQRVGLRGRVDAGREVGQHRADLVGVEDRVDRGVHGGLVRLVGLGPRGAVAGLAHRLLGVAVEALGQVGQVVGGPRAEHGLPQQRAERRVGDGREAQQLLERLLPVAGLLGQHRDAGADVLAALGVVGRQGGHRDRPVALAGGHRVVELRDVDGEDRRVGADLVERGEARPAVERAVLHALGHHHAGGLLEAAGRLAPLVVHHRLEDVVGLREVGPLGARRGEGLVEVVAALGEVGAVDREAGEQLTDRVGDGVLVGALVPGLEVGGHLAGDPQDLGVQDPVGDGALVVVDHPGPVDGGAAEPVLERRQGRLAGGVGEHAVDERERVVAGGAGGRPLGRQLLPRLEDLLDQDVGTAGQRGEVVEVALGVAQAVGVVDAEAVDEALVEPALDLDVGLGEDLGVLDAHGGEGVDREEAAVVEVLVGRAPVDQLVVLLLQRGRAGRQREALVVVADLAPTLGRGHDLDGVLVVVADDGDDDAAVARGPVDVEGVGVLGGTAQPQHVPPPRVLARRGHADVVGHDVDQDPHAEATRLGRDRGQALLAAPLGVDVVEGDHVVAVGAARLGRQQRREVDPVHAEVVEVGQHPRRGVEVEVRADLEPVGAVGRTHRAGRFGHEASVPDRAASDAATEWSGLASGSECSRSTTRLWVPSCERAARLQRRLGVGVTAGVDHDVPRGGVLLRRQRHLRVAVGVEVEQEVVVGDRRCRGRPCRRCRRR